MGSLWGLALPFFFCCWEAGAAGRSAGPRTHGPGPLVTMNHTELPAVTLGVNTSSKGASQAAGLTDPSVPSHIPLESQTLGIQTLDKTSIPVSTLSEAETRKAKLLFSAAEAKALTKITPSKFTVVMTTPVEISATSGSSSGIGMTTVEPVTDSDLSVAAFGILCTDDSSEEAKGIMADALPLAPTPIEAGALALESSPVPAITSFLAQEPDITVPPKALVAYTITDIVATNCSIIEIKAAAIIPGTPDIDRSPTRGRALPTPETSAVPGFSEAKSYLTRVMTSSETFSTISTTASITPDTTVEPLQAASSTTEGETTVAKATTSSGTLMKVSMNPLEETLTPSIETENLTKVSGAVTISTEAGPTVGKVASSIGSSATVHRLLEVTTIQKSTPSETSVTDSPTGGPIPTSRSPLPSVLLTIANSSQEADITSAKTTASAKTSKTASMARGKPPTATPTSAWIRWTTEVTTGGNEGFLLLQLSVASPEDLTDLRVVERLMHQLRHELHTHVPTTQVSLLHVRRD